MSFERTILTALAWGLLATTTVAEAAPRKLVDALMRNDNYKVRLKAARALGRIRTKAAQEALVIALGDPHPLVRASAANAIGKRRPPAALAGLCKLRGDRDNLVQRTAAKALEGYGGSAACDRRKVLVALTVTGIDGPLGQAISDRLAAQTRTHARMVVEDGNTTELRAQVDAGSAPGVKLMVRAAHRVQRAAATTTISCEMAQSIFDLKLQALRGSATQRASVEVGGANVSEREVEVQTRACLEALVPAVYDGLAGYVARL